MRQVKMDVARRRITFPHRFGCFEKIPCTASDEEMIGEDEEYSPRKTRRRKRKNEIKPEVSSDLCAIRKCDQFSPEVQHQDADDPSDEKKKHGANAYVCDECGKILRSKDTLSRHRISHSGAKPFVCDICDKGFSSAVTLKEHKARHDNKMLYECNICSKKFRQNSCYCRHLKTHAKVSPHVCPHCNQKFALKDYLRSHMKKHTGERKYICTQCKKAFLHQSDLNRHKITHTGERPYKCDTCGLTFTDNSSRRRHAKDHSNHSKSEMHPCNQCSLKFTSEVLLHQHVKRKHDSSNLSPSTEHRQTSDDLLEVDVQIVKDTDFDSSQFILKNATGDNLHSTEQISTNEYPTVITAATKAVPCEIADYQKYLDSDGYNNSYIELENTLQAPPASTFREELRLTPVENVHEDVHEPHSENMHYRYFTAEINPVEKPPANFLPSELQTVPSTSIQVDYVTCPDFNSTNYYTWLSDFVSLCKLLTFPIESELFNKISQVHKSIADVLANPLGLLCSKSNFKILRSFSQDLLQVTEGHLNFIYEHL